MKHPCCFRHRDLFPLYTTQQLLEDANTYLLALGEDCGVREE